MPSRIAHRIPTAHNRDSLWTAARKALATVSDFAQAICPEAQLALRAVVGAKDTVAAELGDTGLTDKVVKPL